jgi:hypothetical protein
MVKPDPHSSQSGKTDPNAEAADLRSRLDALKAELGDAVASEKAEGAASRNVLRIRRQHAARRRRPKA